MCERLLIQESSGETTFWLLFGGEVLEAEGGEGGETREKGSRGQGKI